jgi:osmotically-inducible protein OsmY
MSLQTDRNERLYADDLLDAARDALQRMAIRGIACEYRDGMLFLRGQVPSYYHKQMIQESVMAIKGVTRVINEVEVIAPRPR